MYSIVCGSIDANIDITALKSTPALVIAQPEPPEEPDALPALLPEAEVLLLLAASARRDESADSAAPEPASRTRLTTGRAATPSSTPMSISRTVYGTKEERRLKKWRSATPVSRKTLR